MHRTHPDLFYGSCLRLCLARKLVTCISKCLLTAVRAERERASRAVTKPDCAL